MSVAIGVALAKKLDGDDKTVFVLTGDGELQEGQVWEAAMFAPHNKLDNLIVTVDLNGRQIDGDTKDVLSLGDIEGKWKTFGWEVMTIENGNDMTEVINGLKEAKSRLGNGKPVCILLKTEMGYPIDFMVGTHKWHGAAPNDDQLAKALAQLEETLGDY
jgi:transketolase